MVLVISQNGILNGWYQYQPAFSVKISLFWPNIYYKHPHPITSQSMGKLEINIFSNY